MTFSLRNLLLLAFLASLARLSYGLGLGDIQLKSRLGEPLAAEIAVFGNPDEAVENACFTLGSLPQADLPVLTAARLKLVKEDKQFRLLVTGRKPLTDPALILSLRAGCGVVLQRDYILMPAPPADAELPTVAGPRPGGAVPAAPTPGTPWQTVGGESLADIAETLYPGDASRQRRMRSALRRANPHQDENASLDAGVVVRIPRLKEKEASSPVDEQALQLGSSLPGLDTRPPRPRRVSPKGTSTDRLVLGSAPEDLLAPGRAGNEDGLPAVEARILKLETSLHLLNEEIGKLNKVLDVAAEAAAARHQLRIARESRPGLPPAATPEPAPPPTSQNRNAWLELALGALAGGTLAALGAHGLSRRRERSLGSQAARLSDKSRQRRAP